MKLSNIVRIVVAASNWRWNMLTTKKPLVGCALAVWP